MKKNWLFLAIAVLPVFLSGCGLSIYEDWKQSGGKAITGAGAVAGKDYVNGLLPSENSRKYFAQISENNQPLETIHRSDDGESKSGVRFVKNGGILIPPGVTISFENKGYCMDPCLAAPVANEEYQLIPVTQLIPEELQGTYKKLVTKASAGDESVRRNMQHLVWALRTAGTDAAFANNLTKEQKRILDRCSEYSGQFEEFNATAKKNSQMMKQLVGLADSYLNVTVGGVSYKASDLLDPDIGKKKINEHMNQLISMGQSQAVEHSGFNYGELQSGIYTDVRGSGVLAFTAKIANSSNKPYIFYPTDYVGQVGSGVSDKSSSLSFFATSSSTQRQRVTGGNPDEVNVENEEKTEEKCICAEIVNRKSEIQKKHAWRYDTVVACRFVQNTIYNLPGIGGAVKFFYKSFHGDYESYAEAGKDAAAVLAGAYWDQVKRIDFSLIAGNDIGHVASAIDTAVDVSNVKGAISDTNGMIQELKKDFAKIDKIIQREINALPKCPVHSK